MQVWGGHAFKSTQHARKRLYGGVGASSTQTNRQTTNQTNTQPLPSSLKLQRLQGRCVRATSSNAWSSAIEAARADYVVVASFDCLRPRFSGSFDSVSNSGSPFASLPHACQRSGEVLPIVPFRRCAASVPHSSADGAPFLPDMSADPFCVGSTALRPSVVWACLAVVER